MHGSHSRSPSKNSENSFYNQKSEISDISYITNITNIVPTKQPNINDNNNNIPLYIYKLFCILIA